MSRDKITTSYRGYDLVIENRSILVLAPNGDSKRWGSMARARKWVRRHRGDRG